MSADNRSDYCGGFVRVGGLLLVAIDKNLVRTLMVNSLMVVIVEKLGRTLGVNSL